MNIAKQSTAKTFLVGPILDEDGVAKTDEVVASIKVTKNGSVGAVDAQDTLTHNHTGHYVFVSDGGDFDTVGIVEFSLNSGTNAMAPVRFQVIEESVYDAVYAAAAVGSVAQTGDSYAKLTDATYGLSALKTLIDAASAAANWAARMIRMRNG